MLRPAIALLVVAVLAGCQPAVAPTAAPAPTDLAPTLAMFTRSAPRVVYLLDCANASAPAFRYTQAELIASLRTLQPGQQFSVVLFSGPAPSALAIEGRSGLFAGTVENQRAARQFILDSPTPGAADHDALWPAVQLACQLDHSAGAPDALILLTQRSCSEKMAARIVQLAHDGASEKMRINVVLFVNPQAEPGLRKLASDSGGQFLFVQAVDLGKE